MTSDSFNNEPIKEIPLKHFGVIKSPEAKKQTSGLIKVLKPLKRFAPTQQLPVEIPEAQKECDTEPSEQNEPTLETKKPELVEQSTPQLNTSDVMKKNINEEMNQYRQQQLQDIKEELNQLKEKTFHDAYEEGKAKGEALFSSHVNDLLNSINQLGAQKKIDTSEKRDFIIKLAVAMAERIINKKLDDDSSIFNDLFHEAFDKITDKDHVIIELNPEDEPLFREYQHKFEKKFKDIQTLDVKPNEDIARGGCTIETTLGYINATVASKIDLLVQGINEFHTIEDQGMTVSQLDAGSDAISQEIAAKEGDDHEDHDDEDDGHEDHDDEDDDHDDHDDHDDDDHEDDDHDDDDDDHEDDDHDDFDDFDDFDLGDFDDDFEFDDDE